MQSTDFDWKHHFFFFYVIDIFLEHSDIVHILNSEYLNLYVTKLPVCELIDITYQYVDTKRNKIRN